MKTEIGFDDPAECSGFKGKGCFFKWSNHKVAPEPTQITAFILVAGIG